MRRLIITLALIGCTIGAKAQAPDAVDHVESEARFANPERGFYLYENLLNLSREIGRRRAEIHADMGQKSPRCLSRANASTTGCTRLALPGVLPRRAAAA